MPPPTDFEYVLRGGDARGGAAERFLAKVEHDNPQQVMARVTGNYKRGNERR